jgi:hypothetical protein
VAGLWHFVSAEWGEREDWRHDDCANDRPDYLAPHTDLLLNRHDWFFERVTGNGVRFFAGCATLPGSSPDLIESGGVAALNHRLIAAIPPG